MKVGGNKNMFSSKKVRADEKKRKRRMNRKKMLQAIAKRRQEEKGSSFLDQQVVKTSSTLSQSQKMEFDLIRLELKLLKDAYKKHRKLHENCNIEFQNQNLKVQKGGNLKLKTPILHKNKILERDNDEVELSNPRVMKEEYVEYVEKNTFKSEPFDYDHEKKETLIEQKE